MARPPRDLASARYRGAGSCGRNRGQQRTGVLVLGVVEQLAGGSVLDRRAVPHDEHVVAHSLDDREIVTDEQVGQVQFALQLRQQVQDPRLDRDVQRRSRFVEDEQVGLASRAPGRCSPVGAVRRTARAGSATRTTLKGRRVRAVRRPALWRASLALCKPMHPQWLRDRRSRAGARVERRERVLEDEADSSAQGLLCAAAHTEHVGRPAVALPASGLTRPVSAAATVDLPEPDSPTSPSVVPRRI